jgi:hypothetical protein
VIVGAVWGLSAAGLRPDDQVSRGELIVGAVWGLRAAGLHPDDQVSRG